MVIRYSTMREEAYSTDLSDAEWACLEDHLPAPKIGGRPRAHPVREILDAVFLSSVLGGRAVPESSSRTASVNVPPMSMPTK